MAPLQPVQRLGFGHAPLEQLGAKGTLVGIGSKGVQTRLRRKSGMGGFGPRCSGPQKPAREIWRLAGGHVAERGNFESAAICSQTKTKYYQVRRMSLCNIN